jgi:transcriptional regulator with XRE-family HTH domain
MYELLEQLLKERGITAYRLAKETGVTTATLTSWKKGIYTPKLDKLQKIADYFGVSVEYFMGESEEKIEDPSRTTTKDRHDFKKILDGDEPILFNGVPMTREDREKIKRVMEAMFWDESKK